jgi:hypothetical protein
MTATTRWVSYDVAATGEAIVGGSTASGVGTRGFSEATASVGDTFDIGPTTNRLYVNIDGDPATTYITLASGTDLDPRFVAKDITEKLHNLGKIGSYETGYDHAQCVWTNDDSASRLIIYSGSLGSNSQVAVTSGTNTAHTELGFGSVSEPSGSATSNSFNGGISVSGTYNGFFDEIYHIVISKGTDQNGDANIGTPSKETGNNYTGTMTKGGVFTHTSSIDYSISIDATNGTTMNGGTGNVPTMSWTSTGSADDGGPIELLFANYWYNVGTKGVKVKFTDAVFNTIDPAWTIECAPNDRAQGANATAAVDTAQFIFTSNRGDEWSAAATATSTYTRLGTRGLYVKWIGSNNLSAADEFFVICTPPQPQSYGITNLNYGNVTVSTESNVKTVMFEIMSGAKEISSVKFGLQSDGSFTHHDQGSNDTKFRFGTVGPGNNAGSSPTDGKEWRVSVTAADISSDTPPSYLYATKEDLAVVADADNSETIGTSPYMGMVADPIWLGIKLGASEVGANSTINYRIYFDYA